MSSTSSGGKATRVLACVLCQHRKIKCDRNTPCSNCLKAGVTCTPSVPAPARKRRRPNQDLQERLARCEQLLKQYASASVDGPPTAAATQPDSSVTSSASTSGPVASSPTISVSRREATPASTSTGGSSLDDQWRPAGRVVVEDGSVTFADSFFWNNIQEQLSAMKAIVESEEVEEQSPFSSEALTPDDNVDLLLENFSAIDLEDVAPDPVQIFRLWQVFLERVNPVSKIIHTPSVQPLMVDAAANHTNVPNNVQALLFSIYVMAVLTLSDTECRQILDISKDQALKQFSAGVKAALGKVNFLRNYDMTTLQALVLHMLSLQGRYNRHAAWILCGTVIRIAQKMGLHRDGELLNLSPFETEMRRRVWWNIVLLDAKFTLTSGFSMSLLGDWDTQLPQNINDADLFPGAIEPVTPRQGPTEMVYCIFMYEVGRFILKTQGHQQIEKAILEIGSTKETQQKELDNYMKLVDELNTRLVELEDQYLDISAGGIHVLASQVRPMIVDKVRSMMVPIREQPEFGTEIRTPQDQLFKITLVSSENALATYKKIETTGFLWFHKLHMHMEVLAVLSGHLIQQPVGKLSDRAWNLLEQVYYYHDELLDISHKASLSMATVNLKAWRVRERVMAQMGMPVTPPKFISRLQELLPQSHGEPSSAGPSPAIPGTAKMPMGQEMAMNPFLGGFLEPPSSFDWEMWPEAGDQFPVATEANATAFGGFGAFTQSNNW